MSLILKEVDMPICSNEECVVVIRKDKAVVKQTGYKEETIEVIQIPKGHGRIADVGGVRNELDEMLVEGETFVTAAVFAKLTIDAAPTILEAEE